MLPLATRRPTRITAARACRWCGPRVGHAPSRGGAEPRLDDPEPLPSLRSGQAVREHAAWALPRVGIRARSTDEPQPPATAAPPIHGRCVAPGMRDRSLAIRVSGTDDPPDLLGAKRGRRIEPGR